MIDAPAFIFDFDGLLVDTESSALRAWREQFAVRDIEFPLEVWHRYIGSQGSQQAMLDAMRSRGIEFNDKELLAEWRERHMGILRTEFLREGVQTFLDTAAAAGSKLAVASSATRDWLDEHLGRLAIRDRFAVVCARDNGRVKPAPDIYLAALNALGAAAANAIAFEDSPNGITAAKAAGLYCVAVPNPVTADLPLDRADLRVGSFTDLTVSGLVDRLRARPGYAAANVQAPAP
jgi:beta-phosphoglucomutase-like phosphatase (HAD superfamily)